MEITFDDKDERYMEVLVGTVQDIEQTVNEHGGSEGDWQPRDAPGIVRVKCNDGYTIRFYAADDETAITIYGKLF